MHWLVTGGAGFIGSNLAIYLLAHGHRVTVFDNFSTGTIDNIERVEKVGGDQFRYITGDIRSNSELKGIFNDVDCVVHLAAQVSVPRSVADPSENDEINIRGFENVLNRAVNANVRTFIYASSCAIYGNNSNLPLAEKAAPNPLSPYAKSKLMNEKIAHRFAEKYPKTKVVGLRFFNIYGAWQGFSGGYASVIPKWIHCLMTDQQPILYGDGTATRDFCFVDEISKIILGIPLKPESVRSTIYNIGAGQPIELLHLFSVISHVIQLKGKYKKFSAPKFLEPRKGDILHSLADISLARNELGFTPSIKLEVGIEKILDNQYFALEVG